MARIDAGGKLCVNSQVIFGRSCDSFPPRGDQIVDRWRRITVRKIQVDAYGHN